MLQSALSRSDVAGWRAMEESGVRPARMCDMLKKLLLLFDGRFVVGVAFSRSAGRSQHLSLRGVFSLMGRPNFQNEKLLRAGMAL